MAVDFEVPEENLSGGYISSDVPELTLLRRGKVRDVYDLPRFDALGLVTTERQSALNHVVCATKGKAPALNLGSAYLMGQTSHIVPNHVIDVPHPFVTIAKTGHRRPVVEMVYRNYVAVSRSPTSLWRKVNLDGQDEVYGYHFDRKFRPWEKLPEPLLTPTTKSDEKDEMLTLDQAKYLVDQEWGKGRYEEMAEAGRAVMDTLINIFDRAGLVFIDTKLEFALDKEGKLMLIDELGTPDSSRIADQRGFAARIRRTGKPRLFDKEILREWLTDEGGGNWNGDGPIPVLPDSKRRELSLVYQKPYRRLTGHDLPVLPRNFTKLNNSIRDALIQPVF